MPVQLYVNKTMYTVVCIRIRTYYLRLRRQRRILTVLSVINTTKTNHNPNSRQLFKICEINNCESGTTQ